MKLIDLISMQDENINALLISADAVDLCVYDGKNAFDDKYNNCDVISISASIINGIATIVYVIDFVVDDAEI